MKILVVLSGNLSMGGVETYLANTIEHICTDAFGIDVFIPCEIESQKMALRLAESGCGLYEQKLGSNMAGKIKAGIRLYQFLKVHRYDIIHINSGRISTQALGLLAARLRGVEVRIAHSHNGAVKAGFLKRCMQAALRRVAVANATRFAACSRAAAEWLFGAEQAEHAVIARNGINTQTFAFQEEARDACRRDFHLDGCFVIGHVGRFVEQKNHRFLIKVFKRVAERDPTARLLLIGEGGLERESRALAGRYGLTGKILFAGITETVERDMCAMDVFVLPSLFEGAPVVIVEAQASGLPCIVSDAVTEETKLTDLVEFLPLEAGAEAWADKILQCRMKKAQVSREDAWLEIRRAGYDISDTAQAVYELYMQGRV